MSYHVTEEEQIEQIKRFWQTYGRIILTAIVLVTLATAGWQWWQAREARLAGLASSTFDTLLKSAQQVDIPGLQAAAKQLQTHYPTSPYAKLASFYAAKAYVLKNDRQQAMQQLQWIVAQPGHPALQALARLRLARLQLASQQPQQSMATLTQITDQRFQGLVEAVKGDVFYQQKNLAKARQHYHKASQALGPQSPLLAYVALKRDNAFAGVTA